MSIQSDTEMLSVAAVEQYAAQNHMAAEDVYKRFRMILFCFMERMRILQK